MVDNENAEIKNSDLDDLDINADEPDTDSVPTDIPASEGENLPNDQEINQDNDQKSDDLLKPESADDLISEDEKSLWERAKQAGKNLISKKRNPEEKEIPQNWDGSSPTEPLGKPAKGFTKEENDAANQAEAERVLREHRDSVEAQKGRTGQYLSPLDKEFQNLTISFKDKPVSLKLKNGIYKIKESDYSEIGEREEFIAALLKNKFTEI